MEKFSVAPGIYWVSVPEADIRLLCGTPMDAIKHLKQKGLVRSAEKKGILFETGPNAILLSDRAMQSGSFCNLSEFPILHMIYKQGLSIKGHPNYSKNKPLLLGSPSQVEAQKNYIFIGNMGLSSKQSLHDAGIRKDRVEDLWRLKILFNHGKIPKTEDIVDTLDIENEEIEIRNGLHIRRISTNHFRLRYKKETMDVDLNLKSDEQYHSPFYLNYHRIKREYFSIIHSGEGNGWDHERPCMGSVVTYLGKFYLIDTGPNITDILKSLGIGLNQIEGIFHTHAHDDHFAGLTSLMFSSHRIKYYAAKCVRMTVQKKMASLLGRNEEIFKKIFNVTDLEIDHWNNIGGLEVLPLVSPHPLETTIFYFRTMSKQNYKIYGHLADIIGKSTLLSFTHKKNPISNEFFNQVWNNYLRPADIKKIDTGLGFVHGNAKDFKEDESKKLILSHKDTALTAEEKIIGSNATFGQQDVLIPALNNFDVLYARERLIEYFPEAPTEDIQLLMNNPLVNYSPGTILLKAGKIPGSVFLITSGFAEYVQGDKNVSISLTAGSLLGEMSSLVKSPLKGTYRTACYVKALEIPASLYSWFIKKNEFYENTLLLQERREFIYDSLILGPHLSYPLQSSIAGAIQIENWEPGHVLDLKGKGSSLYILKSGRVQLTCGTEKSLDLGAGDPLGITNVLTLIEGKDFHILQAEVLKPTTAYSIPVNIIKDSPYLQWTLLDIYEKRLSEN